MEGINVTGGNVNQQASLQDPNANFGFSESAQVDQPMAMAENLPIPTDQGQAQGMHPMDPKRLKRVNASREYSQRLKWQSPFPGSTEYHELKKERDMLKQISLQRHAPVAAAAEMAVQPNHYSMVNNLPMDQSGFNQFTGGAGPSNMAAAPNQNMGNVQFGFMAPDQTSGNLQFGFGPSVGLDGHGPSIGDNGHRDQM
ncbi:hypothetical protein CCACVL1_11745 [Corchorus capsularis]|uniref:Uncharacterized protein n=1 Tax=Corchorus capsularis TaxID=210143 RepID=A0A1R3IJX5_COCAP|nr:hypothetical protein CCACVL1_11745 [Corchorus capsularis]